MNSDRIAKQIGSLESALQNLGEAFAKFAEELAKTICDICEEIPDLLEIAKAAADAEIIEEKKRKERAGWKRKTYIFKKYTAPVFKVRPCARSNI